METTLEARVEKLERYITSLQKDQWVAASVVTDLTGWDNEGLRRFRENGTLKYRIVSVTNGEKKKTVYKYLLSSIPFQYLKKAS